MRKMRRIYTILMAAMAVALLFMACQPTPEDDIVARKDSERMIEAAGTEQTLSGTPIAEQYGAPEHYEYETSELDGRFTLKVDADVVVPDVGALPIVRVQATDFTQEQVSGVFDALCGDTEMWNVSDGGERTKSEIEDTILFIQKNLSDETYLNETDKAILEADRAQLEYLQSIYDKAPETIEPTRCNGELTLKTDLDVVAGIPNYTYMGMYAMSDDNQIEIFTENRSKDCAEDGSDGAQRSATMRYLNHRRISNFEIENSKRITDINTIPEQSKGGLTITPAQAVDMANVFFAEAGLSDYIAVESVYYANNNSYCLCCARCVNDAPGTYIEGVSYGEDQYAPYWEYECINMLVDDDGIFMFNWVAPVTVTEVVTENAALKTFDEAMEIYKDAVSYTYVARLQDNDNVKTFNIDLITLSLQRISEQNELGYGLLVPVWNFYGTEQLSYTGDRGETVNVSSAIMTSMLSINAIDGTIIDIEVGY